MGDREITKMTYYKAIFMLALPLLFVIGQLVGVFPCSWDIRLTAH